MSEKKSPGERLEELVSEIALNDPGFSNLEMRWRALKEWADERFGAEPPKPSPTEQVQGMAPNAQNTGVVSSRVVASVDQSGLPEGHRWADELADAIITCWEHSDGDLAVEACRDIARRALSDTAQGMAPEVREACGVLAKWAAGCPDANFDVLQAAKLVLAELLMTDGSAPAAVPQPAEPVAPVPDPWEETARFHARNEQYYRELLTTIGRMLGPDAFTSDDGSVQSDVLCAKVPELVNTALARVAQLEAELAETKDAALTAGKLWAASSADRDTLRERLAQLQAIADASVALYHSNMCGVGDDNSVGSAWDAAVQAHLASIHKPAPVEPPEPMCGVVDKDPRFGNKACSHAKGHPGMHSWDYDPSGDASSLPDDRDEPVDPPAPSAPVAVQQRTECPECGVHTRTTGEQGHVRGCPNRDNHAAPVPIGTVDHIGSSADGGFPVAPPEPAVAVQQQGEAPWVPAEGETVRIHTPSGDAYRVAQVLRITHEGRRAEVRYPGIEPSPGQAYPSYPISDLEPHSPAQPATPAPDVALALSALEWLTREESVQKCPPVVMKQIAIGIRALGGTPGAQ